MKKLKGEKLKSWLRNKKKGFTEEELNQIIDVELKETNTITLMFIPGVVVNSETEE